MGLLGFICFIVPEPNFRFKSEAVFHSFYGSNAKRRFRGADLKNALERDSGYPDTRMNLSESPIEPRYDELQLPAAMDAIGDASPWVDAIPFPGTVNPVSFVSGNRETRAIRVRYFEKKSASLFAGRAWFGPETVGPPGYSHGGSQAALLDEGMGAAAWLSGKSVLAAKISGRLRDGCGRR